MEHSTHRSLSPLSILCMSFSYVIPFHALYFLFSCLPPDLHFPTPTISCHSLVCFPSLFLLSSLLCASPCRQVRCRMSPEAVLPPDVLQLAVLLCPAACQVHVRFDCSTPHDVLSPIATSLHSLRELSVVCVTSGERSHLNFEDLNAILEHHGSDTLRSLELKVTYLETPTKLTCSSHNAYKYVPVCPSIFQLQTAKVVETSRERKTIQISKFHFPTIGNEKAGEIQMCVVRH